jgi:uncharacterized protein involved in exopolysaccharide biosynthesis
VQTGGNAATASNGLAMLLLKAQAFSLSADLPSQLQVQVGTPGSPGNATDQQSDLEALIVALKKRETELDAAISDLSKQLLDGQAYSFISHTVPASNTLSAAIARDYPQLFNTGRLAQLTDAIPSENPLAAAADKKSKELLQLNGIESLPDYSAKAEPLNQAIDKLEKEILGMQAELEQQQATKQTLVQTRDLAWDTYTTLSRKRSEVDVATAVTGSEVRFAAPAVPPTTRAISRAMMALVAGILGIFLGIVFTFGIEYLGLSLPQTLWGDPGTPWNRAFRWVVTEGAGLPARQTNQTQ